MYDTLKTLNYSSFHCLRASFASISRRVENHRCDHISSEGVRGEGFPLGVLVNNWSLSFVLSHLTGQTRDCLNSLICLHFSLKFLHVFFAPNFQWKCIPQTGADIIKRSPTIFCVDVFHLQHQVLLRSTIMCFVLNVKVFRASSRDTLLDQ